MLHYLEDRGVSYMRLPTGSQPSQEPCLKQPYGRRVELRVRLHSEKLEL